MLHCAVTARVGGGGSADRGGEKETVQGTEYGCLKPLCVCVCVCECATRRHKWLYGTRHACHRCCAVCSCAVGCWRWAWLSCCPLRAVGSAVVWRVIVSQPVSDAVALLQVRVVLGAR